MPRIALTAHRLTIGLGVALLGLLSVMPVAAVGDTVPYRHFTVRDGLPHASVLSLDQGPNGQLWIGTASGLAVYDGHTIRSVALPDSLRTRRIPEVVARPSGTTCAVVGSEALVCLRRGSIKRVLPLPNTPNAPARLLPRGDTLLVVMRSSLWVIPPAPAPVQKHDYDYPITTGAPTTVDASTGFGAVDAARASNGTLWLLDGWRGLGRLSLDGSVRFLDAPLSRSPGSRWSSLRLRPAGSAVLSGGHKTIRVNRATGRRTLLFDEGYSEIRLTEEGFYGARRNRVTRWTPDGTTVFGPALGLPETLYETVFEDDDGGLWIGTGDGLLHLPTPEARHADRIDGKRLRLLDLFGVDDRQNELWVASWGQGLFRLRPTPAHRNPGSSPKWSMKVTGRDGRLHALSRTGWYRRTSTGWFRVNGTLSSIKGAVDSSGTGYFWTGDGLVRLAPSPTATPDTLWHWPREKRGAYACTLAPNGDVLLRSHDTILRVPPAAPHRADTLATVPDYHSQSVGDMVVQNGALWMTLSEDGLVQIDLQESPPTVNRILSSLGGGYVSLGDDSLFVGSKKGLYIVDTETDRLRHRLTTADGLVTNRAAAAQFFGDTLYVSHPEGLSKLPRPSIGASPSSPTALLTRWSVNDASRPLVDSTRLAASERTVSFDFTGVQLARGQDVRYAYRLLPRNTDWTQTAQAFTRYTDLAPGTYHFEVRAHLKNGTAGSTARLTFTIPKAYYETTWFKALVLLGFFLLLGGIYAWRTRTLRRRQEKLRQMVDERTAQLAEEKRKTEQQAQRLETLDEQKNRFFANVSHELRTPLTILHGTTADLLDGTFGALPASARRQLEIMHSNIDRLRRLTNQLLDLARLETAASELDRAPRDLVVLLRNTVRSFAPLAERRGLTLDFTTAVETHPCRVDAEKLEKIVGNLLTNALQHTPEGGAVRVGLDVEDEAPPMAVLQVADTGHGIAPERQDEIFDRFVHGGLEEADRDGTGIGLSLVREFVDLHGGSIALDSTPGEGSTFTVRLPVPPVDPETVEAAAPSEGDDLAPMVPADAPPSPAGDGAPGDDDRPVLLIVEDNAEVRSYLRRHLADTYRLVEASGGRDGLSTARTVEPDLILTDLMMPELDGIELCQQVRADDALARTPIVLLTARAAEEDAVAGLEAGADAYVTKPFSMAELQARLQRLLDAHRTAPKESDGFLAPNVEVTSADEDFLARVTEAIDDNLSRTGFTVEDLAAAVGLSPRQLQRKLKRLTDTTPAAFVRRYRLDVGAQLLENEAGTVSEVAYEVGFGTPETFSSRFEERFGCRPSHYPDGASTPAE